MSKILISGASIAGPALAYWLHRYGFDVTVVERAPALRPGGYKVDVRGAAVEVIDRMGLGDSVRRRATDIRGGTWLTRTGRPMAVLGPDLIGFRDPEDLEILRGDLAEILHRATRGQVEYLFGDTVESIDQDDTGVYVGFEQAAPRTFDLVVGADGLHSRVRELVFGPESQFTHRLGLTVAVFGVPNHMGLDRWEMACTSAGRIVNVYSLQPDTAATAQFFFPAPDPEPGRNDPPAQFRALTHAFAGHGWEIPTLLHAMPDATDFYFDTLAQISMPTWSDHRVSLLGDAAYSPSPASGQGTSLALVGAYLLAGELAAAQGAHHTALPRYEQKMRPFVHRNQQLARDVVDKLVPPTRLQAGMQLAMMRAMPYLPGKHRMLEKIMQPIREAANDIDLGAYSCPRT